MSVRRVFFFNTIQNSFFFRDPMDFPCQAKIGRRGLLFFPRSPSFALASFWNSYRCRIWEQARSVFSWGGRLCNAPFLPSSCYRSTVLVMGVQRLRLLVSFFFTYVGTVRLNLFQWLLGWGFMMIRSMTRFLKADSEADCGTWFSPNSFLPSRDRRSLPHDSWILSLHSDVDELLQLATLRNPDVTCFSSPMRTEF